MRPKATCRIVDEDGYVSVIDVQQVDSVTGSPGLGEVLTSFWGQGGESGVCPLCGWTVEEYRSTGLLGCGLCYSTVYVSAGV